MCNSQEEKSYTFFYFKSSSIVKVSISVDGRRKGQRMQILQNLDMYAGIVSRFGVQCNTDWFKSNIIFSLPLADNSSLHGCPTVESDLCPRNLSEVPIYL